MSELADALTARDQAIADATVKALRAGGWLREAPGVTATVKRVLRDPEGRIQGIVETREVLDVVGS